MWIRSDSSETVPVLIPTDGEFAGKIRFLVITGSGAGDQYIFQGEMDLGDGPGKWYNLAVYSLGRVWTVAEISKKRGQAVPPLVNQNGLQLAKRLLATIPAEFFDTQGFPHDYEWLQGVLNQAG